jgi:hypothetical protein
MIKKIQNCFIIYLISNDKIKQNFMLKDEIEKKIKLKKTQITNKKTYRPVKKSPSVWS